MGAFIDFIFNIPLALAQKATTAEDVASQTNDHLTGLISFVINQIPLWITAIIVVVISFVIARMVKSAVENKMTAEGMEEEHREIQIIAGRTANAAVLIIGITVALKIAGIDLTSIIAAGAFGMGFALQDLIMNFVAGVMILSARHISIGDFISVDGTMGKVVEIQTRATILKAVNGTKIVVPNADLFKNQVINFTSNPFRKITIVNGVAYGSDLKKTMEIILNALKETPGVLVKPKPTVLLYEWGDYSINFKINAWVETKTGWVKVRNKMMINITKALDDAGIDIPYPIQTLYLKKDEADDHIEKMVMEGASNKVEVKSAAPEQIATPVEPALPQNPVGTSAENLEAPAWLKKATQGLSSSNNQVPPAPENIQQNIEPQLAPVPVVPSAQQVVAPVASVAAEPVPAEPIPVAQENPTISPAPLVEPQS